MNSILDLHLKIYLEFEKLFTVSLKFIFKVQ